MVCFLLPLDHYRKNSRCYLTLSVLVAINLSLKSAMGITQGFCALPLSIVAGSKVGLDWTYPLHLGSTVWFSSGKRSAISLAESGNHVTWLTRGEGADGVVWDVQ